MARSPECQSLGTGPLVCQPQEQSEHPQGPFISLWPGDQKQLLDTSCSPAHQGPEGVSSGQSCQGGRVTAGLSPAVGFAVGREAVELPLLACHLFCRSHWVEVGFLWGQDADGSPGVSVLSPSLCTAWDMQGVCRFSILMSPVSSLRRGPWSADIHNRLATRNKIIITAQEKRTGPEFLLPHAAGWLDYHPSC